MVWTALSVLTSENTSLSSTSENVAIRFGEGKQGGTWGVQ